LPLGPSSLLSQCGRIKKNMAVLKSYRARCINQNNFDINFRGKEFYENRKKQEKRRKSFYPKTNLLKVAIV
jgi:hypothetical protein